jgi:Spy/CpxP family protein refolding chaperone
MTGGLQAIMKIHLTLLSLAAAALCAAPNAVHAEDAVPPKPPGGDKAPAPSAEKPAAKPDGERRGPGGRGTPGERLQMMKEKLNLTPEQEEKVKALQEKNGPEMRELMSKGRENLSDADKEKLRELMRGQMEEMAAILTPEQREKLKELRGAGPGGGRKRGDN